MLAACRHGVKMVLDGAARGGVRVLVHDPLRARGKHSHLLEGDRDILRIESRSGPDVNDAMDLGVS